jgi:hypothetical protein
MGEGEGGGEHLDSYTPHLNPLPPGERRYFLRNPKSLPTGRQMFKTQIVSQRFPISDSFRVLSFFHFEFI